MRVLVTGGAGFIGSHIVDELLRCGHEPNVVDNLSSGRRENVPASVPLFEIDVRNTSGLAGVFDKVRPQWVCHQAAQMSVSRSVREPAFDADINVMGLLNVLNESVRVGVKRIVFASSGGVLYGDVFEPADESHPADPISPYGISKWVGERYLRFFTEEHGVQAVALRYSNVYGPRQNPHGEAGVVAIFAQKMLAGGPVTVNGDGRYIRDYVYGSDVAAANRLALEATLPDKFAAFNIGTGIGTDVNELAARIRELVLKCGSRSGRTLNVPQASHGPARPGDLRSNLLCADRAHQALGWTPQVPLPDGLAATVAWFAEPPAP